MLDTDWPSNNVTIVVDTQVIKFPPIDQERLGEQGFQRIRYLTTDEFKQEFLDD